jgi:putative DNA primase/helicase
MLDAAIRITLELVALGFAVCPVAAPRPDGSCSCRLGDSCPRPGKHPIGRGWLKRSLLERSRHRAVALRLRLVPVVSYGLIPTPGSRMIVIDLDDPSVELDIPETLTVSRPTAPPGRGHYYLRLPSDIGEADVPRVFAGGEIRVAGSGHVVGPGCRHVSGDEYGANGLPIAEAPAGLIETIRSLPPRRRGSASGGFDAAGPMDPGSVFEGERHAWLVGQARAMRGWAWDATRIEERLRELNDEICSPPLPDHVAEFDRMAEWAVRTVDPDRPMIVRRRFGPRTPLRSLRSRS